MLAPFPDLVHMERAEATSAPAEMDDLTSTGNLGDPTGATADAGEQLVEAVVSKVASLVDALEGRT